MLSLVVFTGRWQFAFMGIIASGGNPITGALTAVLLGSRNLFYGLTWPPKLKLHGPARLASAHFVIDESTAMAVTRETPRQTRLGFYWTGISDSWRVERHDIRRSAGRQCDRRSEAVRPRRRSRGGIPGAAVAAPDSWYARTVALFAAAVALGVVPVTAAGLRL